VVLGEAGIGKTAELRAQANELQRQGRAAFFLPVEAVAQRGVAKSLDLDNARRLRDWQQEVTSEAWFMLDSIDESELKGQTLSTALNAFSQELEPVLRRIRLVLSSRASDWRSADEQDIRRLATHLAPAASADAPVVSLVQIAPLDENQVAVLAGHYGVGDVAAFLDSVRDANAWSFLERPLDVEWLVQYWTIHKHLGSLRQLIDFNINERLKEKVDRPSVLSPARARVGAQTLALVASLTQASAFLLPDEIIDPKAQDAIDPRSVLTDWSNDELRDLLARGLFDEATYGRVRLHHRSVQEFLAAEQLSDLLNKGLPKQELEALLFRQSSGRIVIPRHLTAIVAWLAATDRDIRKKAIEVAPEHIIDEGDPSALPPDIRRMTLKAYASRFADREQVFHYFDAFGLQRFACVELAETIRALLNDPSEPEHLQRTLLRTIEKGKIAPLADAALAAALAPSTPPHVRTQAIRAVVAAGGPSYRNSLATLATQPPATDPEILAALLDALFPVEVTATAVVGLLAAVRPAPRMTITNLDALLPHLPARCSPAECEQFLAKLTMEMRAPSATPASHSVEVRSERIWLSECLAELMARTVESGPPFPAALADSIELLHEAQRHPDASVHRRVESILSEHPRLCRELFWRHVAALAARGAFPRGYCDLRLIGMLGPTDADVDWLSQDCIERNDVRERLLAFECLAQVLVQLSRDECITVLSGVASASDEAHGVRALTKRLERLKHPPNVSAHPSLSRMSLRQRARKMRERNLQKQDHAALRSNLCALRSGQDVDALIHLYKICVSRKGSGHGTVTSTAIGEKYDDDIAEAGIEGFKRFWRSHEPVQPEDHEPNSTPLLCRVGLVGLDHDIHDGVDLLGLPEPLLRKAVVYATWKLNDFPPWLLPCAKARPDLIRDVFAPCLGLDFESPGDGNTPNLGRIFYKVAYAPIEIRQACAPTVADLLRSGDPPDVQVLVRVLDLLRSCEALSAAELAGLARARSASVATDLPRMSAWWCQWLEHQPSEAVTFLEGALAVAANPKELSEEVFSRLWTLYEDRSSTKPQLRFDRPMLLRLIPLVHTHVRAQDDITHDRVYSPGKRDHSQNLRDSLVKWLAEIPGPETVDALDKLATNPQFSAQRDWLRHLADARAIESVTVQRMSVADATRLVISLVGEPNTTEELFVVALNRLQDIQYYLADGDFSVKAAYNPTNQRILEEPVQNFIAQELEHRRREQYAVVREPEVARKKRPDIRLLNARCDGPVTLEAKIAERWTLPKLEDALRAQLVGMYMKANNSRYGVLLVCSSGPSKTWKVAPGVPRLDFAGVVDRLREVAKEIVAQHPTVSDLRVVAIDFH
jgi:hypothetical protein